MISRKKPLGESEQVTRNRVTEAFDRLCEKLKEKEKTTNAFSALDQGTLTSRIAACEKVRKKFAQYSRLHDAEIGIFMPNLKLRAALKVMGIHRFEQFFESDLDTVREGLKCAGCALPEDLALLHELSRETASAGSSGE